MKVATNSASWLHYISLVLGRKKQDCSLKTITCERRLFLKRYVKTLEYCDAPLMWPPYGETLATYEGWLLARSIESIAYGHRRGMASGEG